MSFYKKEEKSHNPLDFAPSNPAASCVKKLLKCRGAGIKCGRLIMQDSGRRAKGQKRGTRHKNRKEAKKIQEINLLQL